MGFAEVDNVKDIEKSLKKLRKKLCKEARKTNRFFEKLRETDWDALEKAENPEGSEE